MQVKQSAVAFAIIETTESQMCLNYLHVVNIFALSAYEFLWRNRLKIYQLGSRYMVWAAGLVNGLGHGWGEPRSKPETKTKTWRLKTSTCCKLIRPEGCDLPNANPRPKP
jgi:hypothetical protein